MRTSGCARLAVVDWFRKSSEALYGENPETRHLTIGMKLRCMWPRSFVEVCADASDDVIDEMSKNLARAGSAQDSPYSYWLSNL